MGRWHAKTIRNAGGCLLAVMDLDPNEGQRLAAGCRDAKSFSDLQVMLNRVNLDVLHVCTPPSTHNHIAELAIDAGLNLIVEKPLTPTSADAERLYDRAADRGVLMCPVHQFIFQDGVQKAQALLPKIGRIVHMDGTFCSAGGVGLAGDQLDIIVADILPHPLSLMQVFLPAGLSEEVWVTLWPAHGELRAFGEISGISVSIIISMNARPTVCSFQIVGTDGTIHMDLFHGFAFAEPGKVSRTRKLTHPFDLAARTLFAATVNLGRRAIRWEPAYPGLQRLVSTFYRAVHEEADPPIAREDAVAVARARDRLLQSAGSVIAERCEPGWQLIQDKLIASSQ